MTSDEGGENPGGPQRGEGGAEIVQLDAHRKPSKPPARRASDEDDLLPARPEKPPEWEELPEGVDPNSREGIYARANAVMEGARKGRVGGQKLAGMTSMLRLQLEMVREDEARKAMQHDRNRRGDGLPPPPGRVTERVVERVTERVVGAGAGSTFDYRGEADYPLRPPGVVSVSPVAPLMVGEDMLTEMELQAAQLAEAEGWERVAPLPPPPPRGR